MSTLRDLLSPREASASGQFGSIDWARDPQDPRTWILTNQQQASPAGAYVQPSEQPSQPPTVLGQQQPNLQAAGMMGQPGVLGMLPGAGEERAWRSGFRDLRHLLRTGSGEAMPLLNHLIDVGAVIVGPDFGRTAIPFPGGEITRRRLVDLIDRWRDAQAIAAPPPQQ